MRIADGWSGSDLNRMMRYGGIHKEWLPLNARLVGIQIGSAGKMIRCGDVVEDGAEDMDHLVGVPGREDKVEERLKQAIPHHRRCKREGSSEIRDTSGESRPIISRSEWGCVATKWTWKEFKSASNSVVWTRMAHMGLLVE